MNALVLKTSKGLLPSGVRIPPPPQRFNFDMIFLKKHLQDAFLLLERKVISILQLKLNTIFL